MVAYIKMSATCKESRRVEVSAVAAAVVAGAARAHRASDRPTWTCAGRVTAYNTLSATSSGCRATMPAYTACALQTPPHRATVRCGE